MIAARARHHEDFAIEIFPFFLTFLIKGEIFCERPIGLLWGGCHDFLALSLISIRRFKCHISINVGQRHYTIQRLYLESAVKPLPSGMGYKASVLCFFC